MLLQEGKKKKKEQFNVKKREQLCYCLVALNKCCHSEMKLVGGFQVMKITVLEGKLWLWS